MIVYWINYKLNYIALNLLVPIVSMLSCHFEVIYLFDILWKNSQSKRTFSDNVVFFSILQDER
jgi:hypothetical protein